MQKKTLNRDKNLFDLSIFLLLLSFIIALITAPLGLPVPDYESNIFNSITAFAILFVIVFIETSTIFYYRSRGKYAHLERYDE